MTLGSDWERANGFGWRWTFWVGVRTPRGLTSGTPYTRFAWMKNLMNLHSTDLVEHVDGARSVKLELLHGRHHVQ